MLATWSHYDLWQLDLDLEAHGLPKLALPFLDVKKLAARIVGSKSFEETVRELAPDAVAMPRHRAIADARRTARILHRLLHPPLTWRNERGRHGSCYGISGLNMIRGLLDRRAAAATKFSYSSSSSSALISR